MKTISEFNCDQVSAGKAASKQNSCTSYNSVESILRGDPAFDSFRKFRDELLSRLKASGEKSMSASIEALSNTSEVYTVYKDLEGDCKEWDLDNMMGKDGKKIEFFDLFLARFDQVCKDRRSVKQSDLREYTDMLENSFLGQRREKKEIKCFSNILKF